ncbi:putative transcription factor homeobox-WOX family [Lupinus albus]|uniref:Putative transcription factor homeobox-WOX family n=1 Tax=Lupinus albus TaxID=3870 RepID=A0A6A4NJX3_LUPAL|nr:putative transcription factor homeobox-WOX family [Lupinus albus]
MAVVSSAYVVVRCEGFPIRQSISFTLPFQQRKPIFSSLFLSSPSHSSIHASSSKSKNNKKKSSRNVTEGEGEEADAFELLFKQLEEDLKNDDLSKDDDDDDNEITEEDLALLERELEEALGEYDPEILNIDTNDAEISNDSEEGNINDDGDEGPLKLRNWQMKKLAKAVKAGRRKTSIKNLAADLCLDRALVLELLRNPPPSLLMLSLSLPDEPTETVTSLETQPREIVHEEMITDPSESGPKAKVPVHAMQRAWSAQKRLKKTQLYTLEKVYKKSKRPTNAMISSIVHVTNIPRKKVVKWFEDKRAEEGVPDHRIPYQRPVPETA